MQICHISYTVSFCFFAAFCTFYMLHGVLRERAYELYVFIIAILVVLVYCIVEYAFLNVEGRTTVKLVSIFSEHYRNMFYNYGFSAQYYHKAGI